jgi:hypothetical protein
MMAAKRQRRMVDDVSIPDISDDAAERKRVLNVLAQRRYRKIHPPVVVVTSTCLTKGGRQKEAGTSGRVGSSDRKKRFEQE